MALPWSTANRKAIGSSWSYARDGGMGRAGGLPHHRFFVPGPLVEETTVAIDSLAPQLTGVLRLAPGASILLLDGSGREFVATVVVLSRHRARAQIVSSHLNQAEPEFRLTLLQCTLKQDKFEWVLQKGTELGIARFVPVISERSIVRPLTAVRAKYERWHTILREAAEQSGRGRIPELAEPFEWLAAVRNLQGPGLVAWEEANSAPNLMHALGAPADTVEQLSLAIGPEGGLTKAEVDAAEDSGWRRFTLGPRILRAETAAITAAALALSAAGDLG